MIDMTFRLDHVYFIRYSHNIMNWDWDKLQEKRQNQPRWEADGRGDDSRNQNRQGGQVPPEQKKPSNNNPTGQNSGQNRGQNPMDKLKGVKIPGAKWLALGVVAIWLLSGIYIVQPDEAGVVLRFGRYVYTTGAGPHYHWPYPIEEVYKPKVSQIRQIEVGFRSQNVSGGATFQQGRFQPVDEESAMLTGDENIVNVQFSIQYHIKPDGAVDYLFNVTQPDAVVKKAGEAAMREVIGNNAIDAALTDGKTQIQNDVTTLLQTILDSYQLGVQVVAVQMQDVQPPRDVSDAFKDVASAREDKERIKNQAGAYRNELIPRARGMAAEALNQAEAYKQSRLLSADGEARRFLSVWEEYQKAPDITKQRLLYETLEEIYSRPGMEKIILPENLAGNAVPLLSIGGFANTPAAPITQTTPAPTLNPAQAPVTTPGPTGRGGK